MVRSGQGENVWQGMDKEKSKEWSRRKWNGKSPKGMVR